MLASLCFVKINEPIAAFFLVGLVTRRRPEPRSGLNQMTPNCLLVVRRRRGEGDGEREGNVRGRGTRDLTRNWKEGSHETRWAETRR